MIFVNRNVFFSHSMVKNVFYCYCYFYGHTCPKFEYLVWVKRIFYQADDMCHDVFDLAYLCAAEF